MRQTKPTFTVETINFEQVVVELCWVSWAKKGRKAKDPNSLGNSIRASRQSLYVESEDYWDAVCLLLPKGHATLIDADLFEEFASRKWSVLKDSIFWVEHIVHPKKWGVRRCDYHYHYMHPMSREVMRLAGERPKQRGAVLVDHISRVRWDNRRSNLRWATPSQNQQNTGPIPNKSSKFKGVSKPKGSKKWRAQCILRGKRHYLGLFDDEVMAAIAYNSFVKKHCEEFGYLNPIAAYGTD